MAVDCLSIDVITIAGSAGSPGGTGGTNDVNGVAALVARFYRPLGITTDSFPSITATQELVVPRSIPITFLILLCVFSLGRQDSSIMPTAKLS